jgi:hypothetical protein
MSVAAFIYTDPLLNAPVLVQQRLAEMCALESSTVRWERSRKFKAK